MAYYKIFGEQADQGKIDDIMIAGALGDLWALGLGIKEIEVCYGGIRLFTKDGNIINYTVDGGLVTIALAADNFESVPFEVTPEQITIFNKLTMWPLGAFGHSR